MEITDRINRPGFDVTNEEIQESSPDREYLDSKSWLAKITPVSRSGRFHQDQSREEKAKNSPFKDDHPVSFER